MQRINIFSIIALLFTFITLSGCSLLSVKDIAEPNDPSWIAHKKQLLVLDQWDVNGRFAAQGEDDSWSGHFHWQNNANEYTITLSAPLNGGSLRLNGDDTQAILTLEDKRSFTAKNANSLLSKYTGLKLPVNELKYWLRGLPAPSHSIKDISVNPNGSLASLLQNNWRIEFKRYKIVESVALPDKLFLSNHDFDVRLVMQRWINH